MTLPEFHASMQAFARFHGAGAGEEPSDDDFWAFVADATPRPSLLN